jgi:hypothetical protein
MLTRLTCFISKFLNTDDLNKQARNDETVKKYYLGCFPADIKPDVRDECCWIWNVDEQDKSGTHWVGVIKDNDIIIFFDSYGKNPTFFKRKYWVHYFQSLGCKMILNNTAQKQSHISRTCGVWCLMFLKGYYEGQPKLIATTFTSNVELLMNNEQQLQDMSFAAFPSLNNLYKRKCISSKGQICKSYLETYSIK